MQIVIDINLFLICQFQQLYNIFLNRMPSKILILALIVALCLKCSEGHKMVKYTVQDLLDPIKIRPHMFKTQISGQVDIMIPFKQNMNLHGKIINEEYEIQMVKTKQQLLPKEIFNKTTIYAYGGQTKSGYKAGFPGPAIYATKDRPIKVTWKNNIPGPHILPVDYNYPFRSDQAFVKQVPTVPHAHGIATKTSSDGQPQVYWTASGIKSSCYQTQQPCRPNQAIYFYPNQQQAGNNWYHDHAIGITRLNVYAGLAGLYKIIDPQNKKQAQIQDRYGAEVSEEQTKFLVMTDKSFKNDGELFYPADTDNPGFSSWVPEFYGNTMLVNGVVWPKMTLQKGKHRFVLLNACQDRFLNLYFENGNKKIPIQLIRVDGDYYDSQIVLTELFATISTRYQFILDLTLVQGQIVLKNNAAAPYPDGDPENLVPEFTGQVMKIFMQDKQNLSIDEERLKVNFSLNEKQTQSKQLKYPTFQEGQKVFQTLFEVDNQDGDIEALFISGVSMKNGMNCTNSVYKLGKTYDFHIINLTPDSHPIHFHLINMQKVKQYPFDVEAYTQKYFEMNGGMPDRHGFSKYPVTPDPEEFRTGEDQLPKQYEKIFRDTTDCHPQYVTVLRIKFAKNDGSMFQSFNVREQRYVWHCHMLQHEDNQMMKYFCLE